MDAPEKGVETMTIETLTWIVIPVCCLFLIADFFWMRWRDGLTAECGRLKDECRTCDSQECVSGECDYSFDKYNEAG